MMDASCVELSRILSDDIAFKFRLLYRNTENFGCFLYRQIVAKIQVNHRKAYVQFSLCFDFAIMSRELVDFRCALVAPLASFIVQIEI